MKRRPERIGDLLPGVLAELAVRHHATNGAPPMPTTSLPEAYIEARQLTRENVRELWEWIDGKAFYEPDMSISGLTVFTPGGRVKADFGDWIIRTCDGRFYACKPEVFEAVYAAAGGAA